jgi:hypothetical protein
MNSRVLIAVGCIALGVGLAAASFAVRSDAVRWLTLPGILLMLLGGVLWRQVDRAKKQIATTDWYELTAKYHQRTIAHEGDLLALPEAWQRELAALWRLEIEVNNGAYLQFFANWGGESYAYASEALKKIGARKTAQIIDSCQALIDEHFDWNHRPTEDRRLLVPNAILGRHGVQIKEPGSLLPDEVVARIYELSYQFMAYPEDLAKLSMRHYAAYLDGP